MVFSLERDLVDCLVRGLATAVRPKTCQFLAAEMAHRTKIVDLVVADAEDPREVVSDWVRFVPGFKRMDEKQACLVSIVWRERRISLERLARQTWCDPSVLAEDVASLQRMSLIHMNEHRTLVPTEWADWSPGSLIAIEAKLADWKKGLAQAATHTRWADYSYVALPSDGPLGRPGVRLQFETSGIGAILVDGDSQVNLAVKSRRWTSRDYVRQRVALGVFRDLITGSRRWTPLASGQ